MLSFVDTCILHPGPLNGFINISDGELYSLEDIIMRYANFLGIRPRLIYLSKNNPVFGFKSARSKVNGSCFNENQASGPCSDSLLNGWRAPHSFEECLGMEL